jgi:hypothetical protein
MAERDQLYIHGSSLRLTVDNTGCETGASKSNREEGTQIFENEALIVISKVEKLWLNFCM